jgi:hypothetical protein
LQLRWHMARRKVAARARGHTSDAVLKARAACRDRHGHRGKAGGDGLGSPGLATGPAGAGQGRSGLQARPIRIGFVFSNLFLMRKQFHKKLEIV